MKAGDLRNSQYVVLRQHPTPEHGVFYTGSDQQSTLTVPGILALPKGHGHSPTTLSYSQKRGGKGRQTASRSSSECRDSHSYTLSCATLDFCLSGAAGNREDTSCVYFAAIPLFKFMTMDPKLLPPVCAGSHTHLLSLLSHPYHY